MLENVSVKTWKLGQDYTWIIEELKSITNKGENYQTETRHGVQQLIERGVLDSYTIVYRDGKMSGGGGTRPAVQVKEFGSCYQIAVRGFRIAEPGLKQDYFILDTIVPSQVEQGRRLGYQNCIISFNLSNTRLKRNLDRNWHYPRNICGPYIVNGMEQWIYHF